MFNLPDTFREKNEDYIVVNAMKNFIKCRPSIKGRLGDNRAGLIKCITEYANESDATKEDTLNWLDSVVREGIKDLYIKKLTNESMEFVKDTKKVYEIKIITDNVCTKGNRDDITSDIMNLIEKYFSITYEDKSIFTKGKDAYPLRIAATDEEESKVDQKSAREHPLQAT